VRRVFRTAGFRYTHSRKTGVLWRGDLRQCMRFAKRVRRFEEKTLWTTWSRILPWRVDDSLINITRTTKLKLQDLWCGDGPWRHDFCKNSSWLTWRNRRTRCKIHVCYCIQKRNDPESPVHGSYGRKVFCWYGEKLNLCVCRGR